MTLALIIIGSVVAYIATSGLVFGVLQVRRAGSFREPPNEIAAMFWPITLVTYACMYAIPPMVRAPVRLGRRLATPKPQLPEARVVERRAAEAAEREVG